MAHEDFKNGYEYCGKILASEAGVMTNDRQSLEYLKAIHEKICSFRDEINAYQTNNNPCANGYIAETWTEYTFMIDALSKRTGESVSIPPTTFASVDIQSNWGEGFQLKFCRNAWESAKEQATTYRERYHEYIGTLKRAGKEPISLDDYLKLKGIDCDINIDLPIYQAQMRLIPSDQLSDAITALKKRINHDLAIPERQHLVQRYQDVLDKLTDHVESPKGARSIPLTQDESKVLQSLSKEGKFDPANYDITLAKKADYLYLTRSTINAGLNGAMYGAIFKALPNILESIASLVKHGYISSDDIDDVAKQSKEGATQGFLSGFTCSLIKNCCMLGYFGEELQRKSLGSAAGFNNALIVLTTAMMDTIKDSIMLSQNKISKTEYIYRLDKRAFITSFCYGGGYVGQTFLPPVIGYLAGSVVGSILGYFVFEFKEKIFMSICACTGFTFFGIVEQDYELPRNIKEYLGIESMNIEKMEIEEMDVDEMNIEQMYIENLNIERMEAKFVGRGIIGIRKIGYVVE